MYFCDMRKRWKEIYGNTDLGERGWGIKKLQRGALGGGFFGQVSSGVLGSGGSGGATAYGFTTDVYKPLPDIEWDYGKFDLKEIYGILGKLKSPVDLRKMFDIEGIDLKGLGEQDRKNFNMLKTTKMNEYLGKINEKFGGELTQERLQQGDNAMFLQGLLQDYKNYVVNLYSTMAAAQKAYEANAPVYKDVEGKYGSNAKYEADYAKKEMYEKYGTLAPYIRRAKEIVSNNEEIKKKLEALPNEQRERAKEEIERNIFQAMVNKSYQETGTWRDVLNIGHMNTLQDVNITNDIINGIDKLVADTNVEIKPVGNGAGYSTESKEALKYGVASNKMAKHVEAVLQNPKNTSEINIRGMQQISNAFGYTNDDAYNNFAIQDIQEFARQRGQELSQIEEKYKGITKEQYEKMSEQEKSEVKHALNKAKAIASVFGKKEIKSLTTKVYGEKNKDGKYDVTTTEASGIIFSGKQGDLVHYKLAYKEGENIKSKIVSSEAEADKFINSNKDIKPIALVQEGKGINEIDSGELEFMFDKSKEEILKNAAKEDVLSEAMRRIMPKLYNKEGINVHLMPKTNVSVSSNFGAGGADVKDAIIPEWLTFVLQTELTRLDGMQDKSGFTFGGLKNMTATGENVIKSVPPEGYIKNGVAPAIIPVSKELAGLEQGLASKKIAGEVLTLDGKIASENVNNLETVGKGGYIVFTREGDVVKVPTEQEINQSTFRQKNVPLILSNAAEFVAEVALQDKTKTEGLIPDLGNAQNKEGILRKIQAHMDNNSNVRHNVLSYYLFYNPAHTLKYGMYAKKIDKEGKVTDEKFLYVYQPINVDAAKNVMNKDSKQEGDTFTRFKTALANDLPEISSISSMNEVQKILNKKKEASKLNAIQIKTKN